MLANTHKTSEAGHVQVLPEYTSAEELENAFEVALATTEFALA